MKRFQLSIRVLLVVVSYAAVGADAFREADYSWWGRIWETTFYTLTVGAVASAALLSFVRDGRTRMRYLGFAVFGWAYLEFGWFSNEKPMLLPTFLAMNLLDSYILMWEQHQDSWDMRFNVLRAIITQVAGLIGVLVGHLLAVQEERRERNRV